MVISFFKRFVLTLLCCFFTVGIGMAEIKASVVRVGVFQLAPMVYIDVNGWPKGVFVDIIDEIGKAEGWKVEYIKGSWNQGLEKVKNGEIELMAAVMHLARREPFFDFPKEAVFNIWGQVYVHRDVKVSGIFDLEGKTIGVLKSGANGENLIELMSKLGIQGRFVAFDSQEEVARAIKERRVDAGVFTNVHGYGYQQSYQLKQTQIVFDPSYLKFATAEGKNQQIVSTIDRYLSKWKNDQNSPYYKIIERHLGLSEIHEIPYWVRLLVIIGASALGITLLVAFFLTFFNKNLKQKITESTRDLVIELERREVAEKTLKETEEQYRRFVNQSPGISYRFSSKDGIDFWSHSVKKILGYSPEEIIQNPFIWTDSIHPEDIDAVNIAIENTRRNQPFDLEYRIRNKNGEWRWLNDKSTRIKKEEDSVVIEGFALDITIQKTAEQALKDERDLIERIMETSPSGIVRVNAVGQIIFANRHAEKILGIQFSKDTQRTYDDPEWKIMDFYGRSFPMESLPFNIVRRTGKPVFDVRHAVEWPDGRRVFLSINATPLFDPSGKFDGIVTSVEDITDRYRTEKNYKMLFSEMLDGFALHQIICDDLGNPINYRFLEINPAFERLTGLKGESLIGQTVLDVMPQTEPYWIERYGRVALTGEPDIFENYSEELNRYFHVTAFRYALDQFACIFSDITERKMVEEERNRLVEAINQTWEMIVITSVDGNIQYINPAFENITGYPKADVIGKNPRILKSGFQDDRFYKDLWNTVLSGNRWIGQLVNKRKNGKLFTSECSISPIKNEKGEITNFIWISKDITRQIEFEKRIIQTQKMESIGTLAGGIAHDFNNILFPIVGHTEMLIEDIPEKHPFMDSLKEIYIAALRARDLVQQILTFSRQGNSELKIMKMQTIVKEALKLIRSTIPTTISINYNIQHDCGAVKADPTQIHQIVMNLATNAYHAMENDGGELNIVLKELILDQKNLIHPDLKPGKYACLTVSDTGVGMSNEVIDKIFEPFFTTKKDGKGTGMGLSLVHGIIKNLNGAIKVDSRSGTGSEFQVYLPIIKSDFEEEGFLTNQAYQGGTERILLVDDEESIIKMGKQALERLGYKVTSQTSSRKALDIFRANPDTFDLVISDLAMPEISGEKLVTELIKIRPDIPILLCTGFSDKISEKDIEYLGIKGLLLKPIITKDLARKIRDILDTAH